MENKHKILIIDDDRAVCSSIKLLLKKSGFNALAIHHPREASETINSFRPELILLDMNFAIDTSGRQGMGALKEIIAAHPQMPIILMTGWATVQLAVEGMKQGAKDFIAKPWDNKQMVSSIKTLLALNKKETTETAETKIKNFEHIIGKSAGLIDVLNLAKRVSKTNASVLILGESGTGKELIAEAIHYESLRADQPFVKVNLGGISSSLFESEMFGHKKILFKNEN